MLPFEHPEVDFPGMKPHLHYHYLLVIVYTSSGWVEAFPTRTERASKVAWCLLREIFPDMDFLLALESEKVGLKLNIQKTKIMADSY